MYLLPASRYFLLIYLMIDKRDEFQLVQFITSFKIQQVRVIHRMLSRRAVRRHL